MLSTIYNIVRCHSLAELTPNSENYKMQYFDLINGELRIEGWVGSGGWENNIV